MDMAPLAAEMIGAASRPDEGRMTRPSRRSLDTLQTATQAAMMMGLVWPLIVGMPFFWAPPLWVWAGIASGQAEHE